jgi:hypothetical protein
MGGEVNESALRSMGKDGYQPVARAEELSGAFDAIAARVGGLANRFYLLEYCSPKRSGKHTLKLVGNWTGPDGTPLSGTIYKPFDATGFESGCELPGSAITKE